MDIYLGGPSDELEKCELAIHKIRAARHDITYDWTRVVRASRAGADTIPDHVQALNDIDGIRKAGAVILLERYYGGMSEGTSFEHGVAHTLGKPLVVVAARPEALTFFAGATKPRIVATVEEAIEMLSDIKPASIQRSEEIAALQRSVFQNAKAKGFHILDIPRHRELSAMETAWVNSQLMLIVSEVAEATEALRVTGLRPDITSDGKPLGFGSELADALIRILDTAELCGIDLAADIAAKAAYNTTRPIKHGNKKI